MTTTLRPPSPTRTNGGAPALSPPRPSPAPGALHRNRARIGLGLMIIALSILGVVSILSRGAERRSVLALAGDVPAGSVIDGPDLVTVELPTDAGLAVVRAEDTARLVGQTATVTLLKGTLLNPSHVSSEPRVPDGMALVGAVLNPGQYPVGLREGDQVKLVEAASLASPDDTSGVGELGVGEVQEIAEPPVGSGALVVSLSVADESAARIAAAGADGRISLVVVGSR